VSSVQTAPSEKQTPRHSWKRCASPALTALLVALVTSSAAGALTAWYKLDETSGTAAADSSGTANNATYAGAPTLGATGQHRYCTYFAGDGQYVVAPASASLNALGVSNADFSVAFWVMPNGQTGGWRPLLHKGSTDNERGPGIWLNPGSNRIHFHVGTTANWNEGNDSVADIPNGTWTHVACVKAGNQWRCYVNGVLDTTVTLTANTTGNNGPLYIGDDPWYTGSKCSFDDVRIYNAALSDSEIKNLYGVVGYWKLDETSGTTAADSTNAGNAGTYTNGPLINQPGVKNTAATFDGTDDYVGIPDSASLRASDSITIAAWVRPLASANIDRIILNKEGEYELAITDANEIKWAFTNTSPGWAWHQTGVFIPNGAWSHIVVTYDGAQAKTYVNGALVETFAATGDIGDTYPALNELRIGGRSNSPAGKNFAGSIDDVYVFTRALSATDVAALHGLVGYWKFSEGGGTTAVDSTAFANNATLSGGATWETTCAGDNALQTNGTSAVAQTNATFAPPSEGTVAFWMRGAGAPGVQRRILGNGGDWEIRQAPDGSISFDLGASPFTGNEQFTTQAPVCTNGQWYHIVAVFNDVDNSYSVYINGQLRATGISPVDLIPQPPAVMSFGTRTGTPDYWQGALRDVRIYNRRLGTAEIAQLYGLVGHWKFDETSGTSAADSSGAGNTGTVTGTATWNAGRINNALKLDGSTSLTIPTLFGNPRNVTLSAWAKLIAPDTWGAEIISLGDSFALRLDDSGQAKAFFYNGSSWIVVPFNQVYAGAGWHHFAAVFNDGQDYCKLYVDGIERASVATASSLSYTLNQNASIGKHGNGSTTFDFNGWLDDVRVYNRALCAADISALFSGAPFQGVKVIKWVEIQ
jgi:hypothetical protein